MKTLFRFISQSWINMSKEKHNVFYKEQVVIHKVALSQSAIYKHPILTYNDIISTVVLQYSMTLQTSDLLF